MQQFLKISLIVGLMLSIIGQTTAQDPLNLPLPVYLATLETGIVRIEEDGATVTPIVASPVDSYFAVSLFDGRIAYVQNNSLYLADRDGRAARLIVAGTPAPAEFDTGFFVTSRVSDPVFASHDGAQYLYWSQGGIYRVPINVDGVSPEILLENQTGAGAPDYLGGLIFSPVSVSPDGSKLLVNYSTVPEAGGLAILDLTTRELLTIEDESGAPVCCSAEWNNDGSLLYVSSAMLAYFSPGLYFVDTATGQTQTVIAGYAQGQNTMTLIAGAKQVWDGSVIFFSADAELALSEQPVYQAIRTTQEALLAGDTEGEILTTVEGDLSAHVVWSPDTSGILFSGLLDTGDILYTWQRINPAGAPITINVRADYAPAQWGIGPNG